MMYKFINKSIVNSTKFNPYNFIKGKVYKRVQDRSYPGMGAKLHQCIVDECGNYVVILTLSPLARSFIPYNHVLNHYYKLKYMFL